MRGRTATTILTALACAAGATAQETHTEKLLAEYEQKDPTSIETRRMQVQAAYEAVMNPFSNRVIYGADDRIETYLHPDSTLQAMADACAVVVDVSELSDNGNGTFTLSTAPWTSQGGLPLCAGEPFAGQDTMGFCSAFFVGGDLIVTAGHCFFPGDEASTAFVFDFKLNNDGSGPDIIVPADQVYHASTLISQDGGGEFDHAVVQVDRAVTGRNPVRIRRTGTIANTDPLAVIGHPVVLPQKIAGGAECKANNPSMGYFQSNLDTYGGNSGSMVINLNTYEVEGILVRGAPDFVFGSCAASNLVPDSGNTGGGLPFEECTKTTVFASVVPEIGLAVSPAGDTVCYGVLGGPFTNSSVDYTLTNPTSDPISYTVSLSGGFGHFDLDGGSSPVSGTLPASGSTTVNVAVNATANAAPQGIYLQAIVFDDNTNSTSDTRNHTLDTGNTLVNVTGINLFDSGPVGGPFNGTETYTVTSKRPTPVDVEVSVDVNWLDINGGAGPYTASLTSDGDFEDVVVSINSNANALPNGIVSGTITFTNTSDGSMDVFDATLDVGRFIYPSTDTPIAINDNTEFDSVIDVDDSFCIGDVNVVVDISHTFIGDLIVTLISPEGTPVILHNRSGGSADDLMTTYDDDGGTLPDGPGLLTDFDGEGSLGLWTLRVSDNAGADQGTLNSWSLELASIGAVCPPVAHDGGLQVDENFIGDATLDYTTRTGNPTDVIVTVLPLNGNLWTQSDVCIDSVPFTLPNNEQIVQYKPVIGFTGTDSFKFMVDDGLPSNIATMTVNVGGAVGLVDEDFEGGIPGTWQIVDLQPGGSFDTWNTNTYYNNANYTNGSGLAACVDTDEWGSGTGDYDLALITPAVGLDSSSELTYTTNYQNVAAQDFADVDISTDAGANWTNLLSWNEDHGGFYATPGEDITIDLSSYAGQQGLIRFRYYSGTTGGWDWYWEIDDVMISGTAPSTHPADFNRDGIRNTSDFIAFLNAFTAAMPRSDHNTNCIINTADFLAFLNDYNS